MAARMDRLIALLGTPHGETFNSERLSTLQ